MRKTRFVLSAWPSVYLRFSWRYELFVERKIERKGSEASFKAPAGRGRHHRVDSVKDMDTAGHACGRETKRDGECVWKLERQMFAGDFVVLFICKLGCLITSF